MTNIVDVIESLPSPFPELIVVFLVIVLFYLIWLLWYIYKR